MKVQPNVSVFSVANVYLRSTSEPLLLSYHNGSLYFFASSSLEVWRNVTADDLKNGREFNLVSVSREHQFCFYSSNNFALCHSTKGNRLFEFGGNYEDFYDPGYTLLNSVMLSDLDNHPEVKTIVYPGKVVAQYWHNDPYPDVEDGEETNIDDVRPRAPDYYDSQGTIAMQNDSYPPPASDYILLSSKTDECVYIFGGFAAASPKTKFRMFILRDFERSQQEHREMMAKWQTATGATTLEQFWELERYSSCQYVMKEPYPMPFAFTRIDFDSPEISQHFVTEAYRLNGDMFLVNQQSSTYESGKYIKGTATWYALSLSSRECRLMDSYEHAMKEYVYPLSLSDAVDMVDKQHLSGQLLMDWLNHHVKDPYFALLRSAIRCKADPFSSYDYTSDEETVSSCSAPVIVEKRSIACLVTTRTEMRLVSWEIADLKRFRRQK